MKTIDELWKIRDDFAKESTATSRKLGFAGAAICWLFKSNEYIFSVWIYCSLFFLSLFFLFDILQFFITALIYTYYIRIVENASSGIAIEGVPGVPTSINSPSLVCFILKIFFLFMSYTFIAFEFFSRIKF